MLSPSRKRYFKHNSESALGEGTTWLEFTGDEPTRQVEQYGNRFFSSIVPYEPEVGGTLVDQLLPELELRIDEAIEQAEFESVWLTAQTQYETRKQKARDFLHYHKGDATAPTGSEPKIIAHICNDVGAWGKGFVLAISQRWKAPEEAYRGWYQKRADIAFALGGVQIVSVDTKLWVANMIAQHGLRGTSTNPPIRYEALGQCLEKLARHALDLKSSVHMPRIGCGLAGGKWEKVEPLLLSNLCMASIHVTVYDFE